MSDQPSFLTDMEITNLADAVAYWLAYKRLTGHADLFSEASLLTPVAEYLLGDQWKVSAELDCCRLFKIGEAGYVYYDVGAKKGKCEENSLVLETKFLKSNDTRLLQDVVRLAISPNSKCQRLLLVARDATFEPNIIIKLQKCRTLTLQRTEENFQLLNGERFDLNKEVGEAIRKTLKMFDINAVLKEISISTVANQTQGSGTQGSGEQLEQGAGKYRVTIFSMEPKEIAGSDHPLSPPTV